MANLRQQVNRSIKVFRRSDMDIVPREVLHFAQGIVFFTEIKGGFFWSGSIGGGIMMKRLGKHEWSPPVSLGMAAAGVGFQFGAQKVDLIFILNDEAAVKSFTSRGQLKLGGEYSLTAGPLGRTLKGDLSISRKGGFSGVFSYSMSQGAFLGFSFEGTVLIARTKDNNHFYERKVTLAKVLGGDVEIPASKRDPIEKLHRLIIERTYGKDITVAIVQAKQLQQKSSRKLEAQNSMGILDGDDESEDDDHDPVSSGKELLKAVLEPNAAQQPERPLALPQSNYIESTQTNYLQPSRAKTYQTSSLARGSSENFAPVAIDEFKGEEVVESTFSGHDGSEQFDSDKVILMQDHIVDENNEQFQAHNIVSARTGDVGTLIDGTLTEGLGGAYADYCLVLLDNGKVGKISRHVLRLRTA